MAAPEPECGGSDGYRDLRGVRVELDPGTARVGGGGGFAVSFWLYLSSSAGPSSVILHQITAGDDNRLSFLALGEGNKLLLFPLVRLHREAPGPASSYPWPDTTNLSSTSECPLEKWFHIGCEVTETVMHLHVDGSLTAEAPVCSLFDGPDHQDNANQISLVGSDGKLEGYIYNIEVSSVLGNVKEQYKKNPPFKLSIDYSCSDGIEEGDDGIWNIVGGKASCRRNFILEVVLTNAFGEPVKDKEVVASLVYADDGTVVAKSRDDSEPPLSIAVNVSGFEPDSFSRWTFSWVAGCFASDILRASGWRSSSASTVRDRSGGELPSATYPPRAHRVGAPLHVGAAPARPVLMVFVAFSSG